MKVMITKILIINPSGIWHLQKNTANRETKMSNKGTKNYNG